MISPRYCAPNPAGALVLIVWFSLHFKIEQRVFGSLEFGQGLNIADFVRVYTSPFSEASPLRLA
jgi:hypothetical protein